MSSPPLPPPPGENVPDVVGDLPNQAPVLQNPAPVRQNLIVELGIIQEVNNTDSEDEEANLRCGDDSSSEASFEVYSRSSADMSLIDERSTITTVSSVSTERLFGSMVYVIPNEDATKKVKKPKRNDDDDSVETSSGDESSVAASPVSGNVNSPVSLHAEDVHQE